MTDPRTSSRNDLLPTYLRTSTNVDALRHTNHGPRRHDQRLPSNLFEGQSYDQLSYQYESAHHGSRPYGGLSTVFDD